MEENEGINSEKDCRGMHGMHHGNEMNHGMHGNHHGGYSGGNYYGNGMRGFGLKYLILSMASEKEVTGADVIAQVSEKTEGRWIPSPGVIYPSLAKLHDDGYLDLGERDNKKYYKATEKGKETVKGTIFPWNANENSIESILAKMDNYVEYIMDNAGELTESEVEHIKNMYQKLETFK